MLRKIAVVLVLSFSLGGCASLQKIDAIVSGLGTSVSIANPVTQDRLNQLENVAILVFTALNGWKQACVSGSIPSSCKSQIAAVQVYTRQIPPYLNQLRVFVKSNDQINAVSVFNSVSNLINTAKAQAAASGVTLAAGT